MHRFSDYDNDNDCVVFNLCKSARYRVIGLVTADALKVVAPAVEFLGLEQIVVGQARVFAFQCRTEGGPVSLVLPA
ncbi:hypothetical protein [uncultured Thiodictyon sp.]|uniref:hypothetical protein n=1 Tax=uncultured Thiodictyon sp. TaxID=1846217 RepID=UPI0025F78036|nr:hypothetical protein [uncultured Thiodictyon sp.]